MRGRIMRRDYKGYRLRRFGNNSWTIIHSICPWLSLGYFRNLREAFAHIDEHEGPYNLPIIQDSTMFIKLPEVNLCQNGRKRHTR